MSVPDRLPDEAIDGLLDGSPSEEAVGTPLAAYLSELRDDAQATTPAPSPELSTLLAEGLDPAELENAGIPTSATADSSRRGILTWRRRARVLGRVLVAKFAALGILGKAAAAGAAVTVAASSAGAAGVLPEPAQHEFNEIVGREVQEAPAEPADEADPADSDAQTPPETPADTSTTEPLDTDVSDDATGVDDEPGVEGEDVAEDASDDASEAPEDTPAETAPEETPAGAEPGDETVDEAPTDATPSDAPPAETSGEDDNRDTASYQGGSGPEPDSSSESPAADGLRR